MRRSGTYSPFLKNSLQEQQARIFRAVVTSTPKEEGTNRRVLYVRDISITNAQLSEIFEAYPPSNIPHSDTGSGFYSVPDVGTECVVADTHEDGIVQILTYTPHVRTRASTPQGTRNPENTEPGDFYLKSGGHIKAILHLSRGGHASLFAGHFASLTVNGTDKLVSIGDKQFKHFSAVGKHINSYIETDDYTGEDEFTTHTSSFARNFENPGSSDLEYETEMQPKAILTKYIDKALIRAGGIPNWKHATKLYPQHTYQIETRQSTGENPQKKDTITVLRLGHQAGRNLGLYKYGTDLFNPPGTMIELDSKRVTAVSSSSMSWRYGKYEKDIQTRNPDVGFAAPGVDVDFVTGEIFRHQIYEGINPAGGSVLNAVSDSKHYEFEFPHTGTAEQMTVSFGTLTSSKLLSSELEKSVWRKHIHRYDLPLVADPKGISRTQILGPFKELYTYTDKFKHNIGTNTFIHDTTIGDALYQRRWQFNKASGLSTILNEDFSGAIDSKVYKLLHIDEKDNEEYVTFSKDKMELKVITKKNTYLFNMTADAINISIEDKTDSGSIALTTSGIIINAGTNSNNIIKLGGSGGEQQLVTKSWVDNIFSKHMHATAATGPPSIPIPIPAITIPDSGASPFTKQTKAE